MNLENNTNYSQFVHDALVARQYREEVYKIENIEKYWLKYSPQAFVTGINHEILEDLIGLERWLKEIIDDPIVASTQLEKHKYKGEPVTVNDVCQMMLAGIETIRKILLLNKKYTELKFSDKTDRLRLD